MDKIKHKKSDSMISHTLQPIGINKINIRKHKKVYRNTFQIMKENFKAKRSKNNRKKQFNVDNVI